MGRWRQRIDWNPPILNSVVGRPQISNLFFDFAKMWYRVWSRDSRFTRSVQGRRIKGQGHMINAHRSPKYPYDIGNRDRRIQKKLRKCWICNWCIMGLVFKHETNGATSGRLQVAMHRVCHLFLVNIIIIKYWLEWRYREDVARSLHTVQVITISRMLYAKKSM